MLGVEPKITISDAVELLMVDSDNLDLVCKRHSTDYDTVATKLVWVKSRRDTVKEELADCEAHVRMRIKTDGGKYTVQEMADKVRVDVDRVCLSKRLTDLELEVGLWQAKHKSFFERGDMIGLLSRQWLAGFFGDRVERDTSVKQVKSEGICNRVRRGRGSGKKSE